MSEIEEVDERIDQARTAFYDAMDAGQLDLADMAYAQMDDLLVLRFSLPQQRREIVVGEHGPEIVAFREITPKQ